MSTPPNYHTAVGTQLPQLMTGFDGVNQYGVFVKANYAPTVIRKVVATGVIAGAYDIASNATLNASGIGLSPLNSAEDVNAGHYGYALGADDQNRVWLAGNNFASTPLMGVSDANDITHWTAVNYATTFPNYSGIGGAYSTYHCFDRLSTGELIYFLDQRDADNNPIARDWDAWYLPLGASVWVGLVGSGSTAGRAITLTAGSPVPERIYYNGCWVETYPHLDRVWLWGYWRGSWSDVTTQTPTWIIYNDTVKDPSTWKRIDGSSQTMPMTWANSAGDGSNGTVITQVNGSYNYASPQMVVDRSGNPHLFFKEGAASNQWHVYWTGSAWTWQLASTTSPTPSLFASRDNGVMMYRYFNGRIRLTRITGSTSVVDIGGDVTSSYLMPLADPIRHHRDGVLELLIPDGDTARIFTFGDHARFTH